jgi:hypothetical protein
MQGTYVNLAAAIDAIANAERAASEADEAYRTEHNPHMLPVRRTLYHRRAAFAAGMAHAITMLLDGETAAIIEQAAKQRAQELQP